ncbi:MAG: hypothetical protein ACRELA_06425 [Candidatus Rokuibacteriota bacterium]
MSSITGAAASPDELLAHCRTRLSEFKLPQCIVVLDTIPKNDHGKLARERLETNWRETLASSGRRRSREVLQ